MHLNQAGENREPERAYIVEEAEKLEWMMLEGRPSRTAMGAALYRAAHQMMDNPPVFADPLAIRVVGAEGEAALREATDSQRGAQSAPLRAFIAVRSRFAEDRLMEAAAHGVRQYVLLGAGLDTFAYRAKDRFAGTVFEIDHPATQAWKRAMLEGAGIAVPRNVVFAPIDFESERLEDALARAGFDRTAPAFFAWLGVVPYLTHEAVMATLAFVAATEGNEIVFEYVEPETAWDSPGLSRLAQAVAAAGEPLRSGFAPEVLAKDMRALGFSRVDDLEREALNGLYFKDRTDGLQLRGRAHLIHARV